MILVWFLLLLPHRLSDFQQVHTAEVTKLQTMLEEEQRAKQTALQQLEHQRSDIVISMIEDVPNNSDNEDNMGENTGASKNTNYKGNN